MLLSEAEKKLGNSCDDWSVTYRARHASKRGLLDIWSGSTSPFHEGGEMKE